MAWSKRKKIAFAVYYIGLASLAYWVVFFMPRAIMIDFTSREITAYERVGVVGCDSNSMGLTLRCNDNTYSYKVTDDERLLEGAIYIYENSEGGNIVHRLVYYIDPDCNEAVFKGDNNEAGELVNRSQIKYSVMMTRYW